MTTITRALLLAPILICAAGCGDGERARVDASVRLDSGGMLPVDASSGGTDAQTGTDSGGMIGVDSGGVIGVDSGGMMASGACTNAADAMIHESRDVNAAVADCAGDCFGAGPCTTDCVVMSIMLSRPCATCYGDAAQCTVDNCVFECIGGADSPDCMACRVSAGCDAAFEACSGR